MYNNKLTSEQVPERMVIPCYDVILRQPKEASCFSIIVYLSDFRSLLIDRTTSRELFHCQQQ